MKLLLAPTLFSALIIGGCSNSPQPTEPAEQTGQHVAAETTAPAPAVSHAASTDLSGKVLETMQSGGYTYALLDTGDKQVWAAGMTPKLAVGAQVTARGLTPMSGFTSNTLGRTFETIYFCDSMQATGSIAVEEPIIQDSEAPVKVEKAEGGQTVEQIFLEKDKFIGKQIVLHGKVVKFSSGILGKNWIHLQDGTGGSGTNDLTITTDATVDVGDTVTVQGVLIANKDFGAGYKYALIVEDGRVTVD